MREERYVRSVATLACALSIGLVVAGVIVYSTIDKDIDNLDYFQFGVGKTLLVVRKWLCFFFFFLFLPACASGCSCFADRHMYRTVRHSLHSRLAVFCSLSARCSALCLFASICRAVLRTRRLPTSGTASTACAALLTRRFILAARVAFFDINYIRFFSCFVFFFLLFFLFVSRLAAAGNILFGIGGAMQFARALHAC